MGCLEERDEPQGIRDQPYNIHLDPAPEPNNQLLERSPA